MRSAHDVERLFARVFSYAVFCFAPDGTVLTWNPGVEAILGYARDQFVGGSIDRLFTDDDRRAGIPHFEMRAAAVNGESSDDRWHVRRDGSQVFVAGVVTASRDETGAIDYFVKVVRNRTDFIESSNQLRERGDRAEAANREKDADMAVLAHELRQPLNSILGWARMGYHGALADERAGDVFHRIYTSAQSAVRLVDDLLDVARCAAGKLELIVQPTNLAAVVRDAVLEERHHFDTRRIAVTTELPLECIVSGDQVRLRQVVGNLLGNAVKYTPPHGSVRVSLHCDAHHAVLAVADTGAGIPADDLPHIFDRFRQSSGATERQSGLGLGLWLVKQIVERHGGAVTAASGGVDRGAVFTVTLPLTRARHVPPVAATARGLQRSV